MESFDEMLDSFIRLGLAEDVGEGDHTSMACIRSTRVSKAKLLIKDDGIISGVDVAKKIFKEVAAAARRRFFIIYAGYAARCIQCRGKKIITSPG